MAHPSEIVRIPIGDIVNILQEIESAYDLPDEERVKMYGTRGIDLLLDSIENRVETLRSNIVSYGK